MARLPSRVEEKRTPSSSAKATSLQRIGQAQAGSGDVVDALDRGDDAERAVPFAGIAHGVVMRADHHAREAGDLPLIAADDIADLVHARVEPRLAHPAQNKLGGLRVLR